MESEDKKPSKRKRKSKASHVEATPNGPMPPGSALKTALKGMSESKHDRKSGSKVHFKGLSEGASLDHSTPMGHLPVAEMDLSGLTPLPRLAVSDSESEYDESAHESDSDVSSLSSDEDPPALELSLNRKQKRSRSAGNLSLTTSSNLPSKASELQPVCGLDPITNGMAWEDIASSGNDLWLIRLPHNFDERSLKGKAVRLDQPSTITSKSQTGAVQYEARPSPAEETGKPVASSLVLRRRKVSSTAESEIMRAVPNKFVGTVNICEMIELPKVPIPEPKPKKSRLSDFDGLKQRFTPLGADFNPSHKSGRKGKKDRKSKKASKEQEL